MPSFLRVDPSVMCVMGRGGGVEVDTALLLLS